MTLETPPHKIPGHFYSPLVDADAVSQDVARLWPAEPRAFGIDFDDAGHVRLLRDTFPSLIADYDYPQTGPGDDQAERFYEQNGQFGWLDPRILFCVLRTLKPKRIVEVGSGYSTLLMTDVNRRFLGDACRITCIDPFPRPFIVRDAALRRLDLVRERVQDVPLERFAELGPGDVLFIDSSHVCKTGSDVAFLFLQVLPRLRPGVLIHVHDVFLPEEYPKRWVLDVELSWNEQYVLQALLTQNRGYKVVFGSTYAARNFPALVSGLTGAKPYGGSSFWLQRRPYRFLPSLLWRLLGR